jgi:endonuclease/exonuclease/phosphatase family metal-dependent hydrolase
MSRFLLPIALAGLAGCDLGTDPAAPDADPGDAGAELNPDLVPPVGSEETIDVATWNLEWFPKSDRTVGLVADLIVSLELDLIVFEEIASVAGWDELVARLPDHGAVLSTHRYTPTSYQKLGIIYRRDVIDSSEAELLFVEDSWAFPRPALRVHATAGALTFDVIGLHLKAGTEDSDRDRRAEAVRDLDAFLRAQVDGGGEDEVIVLGDFNATLDPLRDDLAEVWPPLLGATDRYTVRTTGLAAEDEASFIPAGILLDHIVTTAGLGGEVGAASAVIPDLDGQLPRYEPDVSDHLPVVLSFPR